MLTKSILQRHGITALCTLLVLLVLVGTGIMLANPKCRDRTLELTADGLCVGAIIGLIRLLNILSRRKPETMPFIYWWCLARLLAWHELKIGMLGGYLLGISRALIECLG